MTDSELSVLPGVGPKRLAQLNRLGLFSLRELLSYFPRSYEDRRTVRPIAQLEDTAAVCVRGTVAGEMQKNRISGGRIMIRTKVFDSTGMLYLTFFNQPYIKLEQGKEYLFFGKPEFQGGRRGMINPIYEEVGKKNSQFGCLVPIYPRMGDIGQNQIRSWMRAALKLAAGHYREPLPLDVVEKYRLCAPEEAFSAIHFPETPENVKTARRRLIFEELFTFCCAGQRLRGERQRLPGTPLRRYDPETFYQTLSYTPTAAQKKAVAQCFDDLCSGRRMNRLLQGDVGSGKTLVAAACAWLAVQNGRQAVIMAPTELLARQHQATMEAFFVPFGIGVELLCGSTPAAEKRRILARADSGEPLVLCGTHALIQGTVELPNAALIVVDEQHRFGVAQRSALGEKSGGAHLLAMSATPIPRTLTLIIYGDLDVSVLDELPPGRQPVFTRTVGEHKRQDLYGFLQKQISEGGQAYIVCPLVEESEASADEKKAATAYIAQLQQLLPDVRFGLMHGRLKAAEKDAVMTAFLQKELDVLVSTTVIEVGVNVPNATLMIVENADNFGLSQLHQLRGRVGRGSRQSYCFLMSQSKTETAKTRLETLCRTNDGFEIAETDLKLRGPGDFFGQRQHGLPAFAIADLASDMNVLEAAQQSAQALLREDPGLSSCPLLAERVEELIRKTLSTSLN